MFNDYSTATDELYTQVVNVINSSFGITIGYDPEIYFPGTEVEEKPDTTKLWLKVTRQTVSNPQTAFGNNYEGLNKRKYTNYGILFIQFFIPKTPAEIYANSIKLAEVLIKNAFRGKVTDSCIWFRNPRINELSSENDWFRFNVIVEYQYDEVN